MRERDGSMVVGVISDTHGMLRPEAVAALRGSQLILHAGDIGKPEVLAGLRRLAPVMAVRGNNDHGDWAQRFPLTEVVGAGPAQLYLLHDVGELDLDPAAAGFAAVVFGHSHHPFAKVRQGVLFLNPGSAGPRRFTLPVSLARLHIDATGVRHEFIELML